MRSRRLPSGRQRPRHSVERLHGRHVIAAALAARRRSLHRLLVRLGPAREDHELLVEAAGRAGVPVVTLEGQELVELAGGMDDVSLQGVLLEAGPLPVLRRPTELLAVQRPPGSVDGPVGGRRIVALDGVEDPRNLGAIARVAEAAGACGLVLTDRRSPPLGPVATRASAGALEWLPVLSVPNLSRAIEGFKNEGFWVVAADAVATHSLYEVPDRWLAGDLVLVLGAEGKGLRPSIRTHADHLVRIPMAGQVESLNVSTAAAVLLFELVRRSSGAPGAPSGG